MSKKNVVQTIELLIENGADVNAETSHGQTALTYASRDAFLKTAEILIANGAEVNSTTSFVNFKVLC